MIRVGVIGAGHWGPHLIRNLHEHRGSEVAHVIDLDIERLALARSRFPGVNVSTDVDEVFRDTTVDAVVIATPTRSHFPLAKRALLAGKHVLVEKPLTDSVSTAVELCRLADRTDKILMVGHVFVHNRAVVAVKRCIDDNRLGEIAYITMVRTNLGGFRPDVNVGWDLASHDISIANFWLNDHPSAVSAVGCQTVNPGTEDTIFATFRYHSGTLVNITVSWLNPRKVRYCTVVGDERMLTFDDMDLAESVRIYNKRVTDERTPVPWMDSFASFREHLHVGDVTIPRITLSEPLFHECDDFITCIEEHRVPRTSGHDGVAVVRALEAIDRSLQKQGQEVEL